mgnify:CR=1 FL=1
MENIPYSPRENFEEEVELKSKPLVTPESPLSTEEKKEKRKHFIEALEKKSEENTEEEIPEETSTEEEISNELENPSDNPTKDADYYNNAMTIASTHDEVDALYKEAIDNGIDENSIFGVYSKRHKEIDDISKETPEESSFEND